MKALGHTWAGMIVLCLLVTPTATARVTSSERALVRAVSKVRVAHGLGPVHGSRSLARSAGRYSRWQLHNDYFGHQPRIRMSSRYGIGGEVLRWVPSWRVGLKWRAAVSSPATPSPPVRTMSSASVEETTSAPAGGEPPAPGHPPGLSPRA